MKEFHKELLDSLIKDWTLEQIETYITELEEREVELTNWIRYLKTVRKKKARKPPLDTGDRGGT
jgi:hypothetical protein